MKCHWEMERDRKVKAQEQEEDWEEEPVDPWALVLERHAVVLVEVVVVVEEKEECEVAVLDIEKMWDKDDENLKG